MSPAKKDVIAETPTSTGLRRPDPLVLTADEHICDSCRGNGWKYVVRRSAMRVMAYTCDRAEASFRRPCLDCGGSGKLPRFEPASRRAALTELASILSPGSQPD